MISELPIEMSEAKAREIADRMNNDPEVKWKYVVEGSGDYATIRVYDELGYPLFYL